LFLWHPVHGIEQRYGSLLIYQTEYSLSRDGGMLHLGYRCQFPEFEEGYLISWDNISFSEGPSEYLISLIRHPPGVFVSL